MSRFETFAPPPAVAYALLVCATAVWGSGMVLGRGVADDIPPIGLGFWRVMLAALVILPIAAPQMILLAPLLRRHWRFILLLGIVQIWPQTMILIALNFTTAINATLINASQPAVTAIMLGVLYRERVTRGQAVGIALALGGILVMVSRGDPAVLTGFQFNTGDWLVLASVGMWAYYAIRLPTVPREIGIATTLFLVSFLGALTMIPAYIYESVYLRAVEWNALTIGTIAYMGIVISAASIFVWNTALRVVGAQKTSIFLNLNPVWAAIFAIWFLDERLYAYHLAGALLVCGGITLVILKTRRARAAEPAL